MFLHRLRAAWLGAALLLCGTGAVCAAEHPLTDEQRAELDQQLAGAIETLTARIEKDPSAIDNYSARGDAYFFHREFDKAVADYEKMLELKPEIAASHWRRGLALYYADNAKEAADQFELCFSLDKSDRENGLWKMISQARATDIATGRQGMLKYEEDDRPPLPSIYRMFAGEIQPADLLKELEQMELTPQERAHHEFYVYLYIGVLHDLEGRNEEARESLAKAVTNRWATQASYGPRYMWHLARVHYEKVAAQAADASK